MNTKHTPGEWIIKKRFAGVAIYVENKIVCSVYGTDQQEANAKLIAAAPELLEALKDLVNAYTEKMGARAVKLRIELAQEALNKAI